MNIENTIYLFPNCIQITFIKQTIQFQCYIKMRQLWCRQCLKLIQLSLFKNKLRWTMKILLRLICILHDKIAKQRMCNTNDYFLFSINMVQDKKMKQFTDKDNMAVNQYIIPLFGNIRLLRSSWKYKINESESIYIKH